MDAPLQPTAMPIRVLLADDNAEFLLELHRVFENLPDITVVADAVSGVQALYLACVLRPDVAVLDVRMPGLTGIQATQRIATLSPAPAVILLSIITDRSYLIEAARIGAAGYFSKTASPSELVEAVRSVAKGDKFLGLLSPATPGQP